MVMSGRGSGVQGKGKEGGDGGGGEVEGVEGVAGGLDARPLRTAIVLKYLEAFPAYDAQADEGLLSRRTEEVLRSVLKSPLS